MIEELNYKTLMERAGGNAQSIDQTEIDRINRYTRFNMLDARLSMENLDTIPGNETQVGVLKNIAKEQEKYNFNCLVNGEGKSAAEKIDAFSKNSVFSLASYTESRWFDEKLEARVGARKGYRVHPSASLRDKADHMRAIVAKFQIRLRGIGLDPKAAREQNENALEKRTEILTEYTRDRQKAELLGYLLHEQKNAKPQDFANDGFERLYQCVKEVAEKNFEEKCEEFGIKRKKAVTPKGKIAAKQI
jgi:hypothetical protein